MNQFWDATTWKFTPSIHRCVFHQQQTSGYLTSILLLLENASVLAKTDSYGRHSKKKSTFAIIQLLDSSMIPQYLESKSICETSLPADQSRRRPWLSCHGSTGISLDYLNRRCCSFQGGQGAGREPQTFLSLSRPLRFVMKAAWVHTVQISMSRPHNRRHWDKL